jgi:hypothetical protein
MSNTLSNIKLTLFGIALFGYGIVGILIDDPDLSRILTIPFRLLVLSLSVFVIFYSLLNQVNYKKQSCSVKNVFSQLRTSAIFAFILLYSTRMVYELINNENLVKEKTEYFSFWFLITLTTGISFFLIDIEDAKKYFHTSYSFLSVIVLMTLSRIGQLEESVLSQSRLSSEGLNPISLGNYGCSLIIISVYSYLYIGSEYKSKFARGLGFLWFSASLIAGIFILIKSNSRGPFVSTIVCVLILFLSRLFEAKKNNIFANMVFGISAVFIVSGLVNSLTQSSDYSVIDRLIDSESEFSSGSIYLHRPELMQKSIDLITSNFVNFLIGAGLEIPGIGYPHNMIVESFLATGIIGGLLFTLIYLGSIWSSMTIILSNNSQWLWLYLLYIQQVVNALFSGCIYTSESFWYLLLSTTVITYSTKYKQALR